MIKTPSTSNSQSEFAKLIWGSVTEAQWDRVLGVQEELEDAHGTFKRFARARKYKRVSKDTFKIVEVTPFP